MARWLTVLMALVAQGMALMSPVCFVRCVGADGHQCIELVGQGCNCCGCPSHEPTQQVCAVSTCCDRCHDQDEEQEAPVGPQLAGQDCTCQHSPLEASQQVPSKALSDFGLSQTLDFVPTRNFVAAVQALKFASLRPSLLRPLESPQLVALATIVLRV
jgi:hypothetical protein